jgi:hypothetical protein
MEPLDSLELLSNLTYNTRFLLNGVQYVRDEVTRDGGGKLACKNLTTNTVEMFDASARVKLVANVGSDPAIGFADFLPRR